MNEIDFEDVRPGIRFSTRSLLGVHSIAAGICEMVAEAPALAAAVVAVAAFILVQAGVVAACTSRIPDCSDVRAGS